MWSEREVKWEVCWGSFEEYYERIGTQNPKDACTEAVLRKDALYGIHGQREEQPRHDQYPLRSASLNGCLFS